MDRISELEKMVVMRFDHDGFPQFTQGFKNHEVLSPVTAEDCAWFVSEIERLRKELSECKPKLREF